MRQIIETQILEKIPVYFFAISDRTNQIEASKKTMKRRKKEKNENAKRRREKKLTGESKLLE